MSEAPRLSIVIPTRGRPHLLARVLGRLEQQVDAPPFEVVIVTDAQESDPRRVAHVVKRTSLAARTLGAQRAGASAARNVGWRAARARLVLFLGDDTLPDGGLLTQHFEWHRRHPAERVAVLGRVRWADEVRVTPFMRWLDEGIQFDYASIEGTEAGWGRFYTANASIKRSLIERVNGFDEERLPFLYEDLDLAYRMRPVGFRLLYNRAAVVEHVHPVTLEEWKDRAAAIAIAEKEFARLHPDVRPYFYDLFSRAKDASRARGRGVRLARFVPRSTPMLGKRIWHSADIAWRQALAEPFLAAWGHASSEPCDLSTEGIAHRSCGRPPCRTGSDMTRDEPEP